MRKSASKLLATLLTVAALAVCVPVSAFAKSSKPLSYLYTYRLNFDGYDTMSISPDDTGYLTVPALPDGYAYWMCNGRHFTPGQQLTYDSLDDWMCPGVDLDDDLGHGRYISSYFMPMTGETVFVHYYTDTTAVKIDAVSVGGSTEVPATADGKKLTVTNKAQADGILAALDGKDYTITKIEKGKRRRQPAPPFITSTLQQDASRAFGFSATRTMRAAQTLYEGVDIAGHGTVGLITYMRTDSLRIAAEAQAAAKTFIADRWGENYVCKTARKWKSRSATAAQDAHEAIRPSMPELTPDEVEQSISGDTAKLYRLIWSRFMASQMADCIQDTVSASITAGDYLFRASGFRVAFDGFTALYEESTDDTKKKETALPPLEEGQKLALKKLTADQKFTQPPPLYTEATLIHALEENGIGRPSTYAPIITTIVDRGYVEKDQKKLKTTPLGQAVNTVMMEQFPNIVDVKFSADMEKKLDVVEAGQADWVKTIDDFYQGFSKSLEQAEKNMEGKRIKVEDIPTDEICEKCGRPMVIKSGRYGKFVACSGFPECRNAHPLVKDTGGLCPLDGGHMLVRKSAKGRVYYGCSNYPKCNYMTWDEPVPEKCPQCGSTLFKKKGQLYCAKEGCGFVKAIEKK